MATETGSATKVVVYYAIWATICAVVAGVVMSLIHAAFFSSNPSGSAVLGGIGVTGAIALGQGAVALVTGNLLARLGYTLQGTVLLGLLIGAFDFGMNLLQLLVPALEPGWRWDLVLIALATVGITLLGARRTATA